jgi:hypothetical protein
MIRNPARLPFSFPYINFDLSQCALLRQWYELAKWRQKWKFRFKYILLLLLPYKSL